MKADTDNRCRRHRVYFCGNDAFARLIETAAFGLTVSEAKTEIMCLQTKDGEHVPFTVTACTNKLSSLCPCAGLSAVIGTSEVSTQLVQSRGHVHTPGGKMKIYDRPTAPLRLERADAERRAF